jgi:hypothetical protein
MYYAVTRSVFKGATIIPLNVLDERNPAPALKYIKAFKKVAKPRRRSGAVHNYSDTNRFSNTRTKKIIKAIGGKPTSGCSRRAASSSSARRSSARPSRPRR